MMRANMRHQQVHIFLGYLLILFRLSTRVSDEPVRQVHKQNTLDISVYEFCNDISVTLLRFTL